MMSTIVSTRLYLPTSQTNERIYHYEYLKNGINGIQNRLSFDFTCIQNGQTDDVPKKTIIKINRSNFLINNENPDETLIGELVSHASQALFPLRLAVNSSGYPKSICNHSYIVDRWKNFIPRFQNYYETGKATSLLNRIGEIYKRADYLLKSLQNDLFFSLFFFPIYGDYGTARVYLSNYEFPLISVGKAMYTIDLELKKEHTEKDKIEILVKGKSELCEENTVSGYFHLNKDRSIHEIKIDFYISDNQENYSIHIQETKEIADRKTGASIAFDDKEEHEKRVRSKGFFVEEIEGEHIAPKHR